MIIIVLLLTLLSGMEWCFGSESAVQEIQVSLGRLSLGAVLYVGKDRVDNYNKIGISCSYNTPFLPLSCSLGDSIMSKCKIDNLESDMQFLQELSALPITLFFNKMNEH